MAAYAILSPPMSAMWIVARSRGRRRCERRSAKRACEAHRVHEIAAVHDLSAAYPEHEQAGGFDRGAGCAQRAPQAPLADHNLRICGIVDEHVLDRIDLQRVIAPRFPIP